MTAPELPEEMVTAVANAIWPLDDLDTDDARQCLCADAWEGLTAAGIPELIAERDETVELLREARRWLPYEGTTHIGTRVDRFLANHETPDD